MDAVTASEQADLFAEWSPGINYTVGSLRRYGGTLYRCVTEHTSQEGWERDNGPHGLSLSERMTPITPGTR